MNAIFYMILINKERIYGVSQSVIRENYGENNGFRRSDKEK